MAKNPRFSRQQRPVKRCFRTLVKYRKLLAFVSLLWTLELLFHISTFTIRQPSTNLDAQFSSSCGLQTDNSTVRENATLVMLARNSEVDDAIASVLSVQEQFNDQFGYGWVFLNDQEWTAEFKTKLSQAIGGRAEAKFEKIPKSMWGYPPWIDQDKATRKMRDMQKAGIMYVGTESYHHMCRFQSGFFFNHPALKPYKYYWRVEPSIRFTCRIPYDPFLAMSKHKKVYGYNIALWEKGETAPSLFRKLSEYKSQLRYPTTGLWTAMMAPSYMFWPFRRLMSVIRNRDENGDLWNMCHFWSNFEIADMDFFRSEGYTRLFDYLDREGGFYYERWGDAPVHSLAVAMLLQPQEVHHFSDFGYVHGGLQYCARAPSAQERRGGHVIPDKMEKAGGEIGCDCMCEEGTRIVEPTCMNRIKSSLG